MGRPQRSRSSTDSFSSSALERARSSRSGPPPTCARLHRTRSSGVFPLGMYVLMASMPAEQAPERMISAFSMITTLSEGSSFAASVATKHPALPPPMIRRSHVTTCISMSDNCFGWKGCIRMAAILAIVVLLKTISECGIHLEDKIRAYRPLFYQSGNSFYGGVTFSCPQPAPTSR